MDAADLKVMDTIRRFIQNPPDNSRVFTITPAIAEVILQEHNTENRPKKTGKIKEFAHYMARGEWKLLGDTIKFSNKGLLRDGQHRLFASIHAGKSFTTHIIFGVNDADFWFMDRGKTRSGADGFAIAGEDEYNVLTGALRWVKLLQTHEVKKRSVFTPAALDDFWRSGKIDQMEMRHAVAMSKDIHEGDVTKTARSMLAALIYIFSEIDIDLAERFFAAWNSNVNDDPEFETLARLNGVDGYVFKSLRRQHGRLHDVTRMALYVKAWNAAYTGRPLMHFRFDPKSHAFPPIQGMGNPKPGQSDDDDETDRQIDADVAEYLDQHA